MASPAIRLRYPHEFERCSEVADQRNTKWGRWSRVTVKKKELKRDDVFVLYVHPAFPPGNRENRTDNNRVRRNVWRHYWRCRILLLSCWTRTPDTGPGNRNQSGPLVVHSRLSYSAWIPYVPVRAMAWWLPCYVLVVYKEDWPQPSNSQLIGHKRCFLGNVWVLQTNAGRIRAHVAAC